MGSRCGEFSSVKGKKRIQTTILEIKFLSVETFPWYIQIFSSIAIQQLSSFILDTSIASQTSTYEFSAEKYLHFECDVELLSSMDFVCN